MNRLICVPPNKDVERAVGLVPQKYVDSMFEIASMELQTVLDVGVLCDDTYTSSPIACKWLNSEVYLSRFVEGLRERTERTYVEFPGRYKEALERIPDTDQVPSWMTHNASYKRQLYALATNDALERLCSRFESLGSGHRFVARVEEMTGLHNTEALRFYVDTRENRRLSYAEVRAKGFWPKEVVKNLVEEMYDQSFRSFLGRGRWSTALGEYSRSYRQNWNFVDADSLLYSEPRVVSSSRLSLALEHRFRRLRADSVTTEVRPSGRMATRTVHVTTPTTACPTTSDTVDLTVDLTEEFLAQSEAAGRTPLPEGWTDESVPLRPQPYSYTGDPTLMEAFDRVSRTTTDFAEAEETPTDLDLRARVARDARHLNVQASDVRTESVSWGADDETPDHLVNNPTYNSDNRRYTATRAVVRPQNDTSGRNSYESV